MERDRKEGTGQSKGLSTISPLTSEQEITQVTMNLALNPGSVSYKVCGLGPQFLHL